MKSLLKVPAKFNVKYIDKLVELNKKYSNSNMVIEETYGSLPNTFIGNARSSNDIEQITYDDLEKYIEYSKNKGINFNYTMNSTWSNCNEFSEEGQNKIIYELKKLKSIGVSRVSVSSPGIMKIIKKHFPEFDVTISINNCVDSVHAVKRWEKENVTRIVLNRHINRDFDLIKSIIKHSNVEIELLLNSLCNLHCSLHNYHNNINSQNSNIECGFVNTNFPQSQCFYNMINSPLELICSAWIRPEDVKLYEDINVNHFKIDGRCMNTDDLVFIIESYLKRNFDGNFFDLFDFLNSRQLDKQLFSFELDNRLLDGFLERVVSKNTSCRVCGGNDNTCKRIASQIKIRGEKYFNIYKSILSKEL